MQGKTLVISGGTKVLVKSVFTNLQSNGINVAFTYNSNQQVCRRYL